jgi:phosphoribosylformylglycinamidine synthase
LHDQRGGQSPIADLQQEMKLIDFLLANNAIFKSAHDLSQGGLAATLIEVTLKNNIGATITLTNVAIELLSETPSRVLIAIDPHDAAKINYPATKIGVTGGDSLNINDASISLTELRKAHTDTFPKLFG